MQNQGQAAAAPFGQQQPPQATSTAMMQQSTSHFATVPGQQAQQGPVQQSVTMPLQHHQQQSQQQQQQQQAPQQLFPHQGLNGGWQSDKDYQERRKMIAKIVYLLQQRKPHAPQEWLKKLPQMAKRLEESLYRSAKSFEEYNDANTLKNRLQQLAVNIGMKTKRMQQQQVTSQQQQPQKIQQPPQQQQQIPQQQHMPQHQKLPQQAPMPQHQSIQQVSLQQQQQLQQNQPQRMVTLSDINPIMGAATSTQQPQSSAPLTSYTQSVTAAPAPMPPPVGAPTLNNHITTGVVTQQQQPTSATATNPTQQQQRQVSDRQQVLRHQQQRLLLLRHAAKCQHEDGKCPVTPHCAGMKRLWKHIAECKNQKCIVPHCVSSRYVLSHYHRCKDVRCPVCGPVREAIHRSHEKQKQMQALKQRHQQAVHQQNQQPQALSGTESALPQDISAMACAPMVTTQPDISSSSIAAVPSSLAQSIPFSGTAGVLESGNDMNQSYQGVQPSGSYQTMATQQPLTQQQMQQLQPQQPLLHHGQTPQIPIQQLSSASGVVAVPTTALAPSVIASSGSILPEQMQEEHQNNQIASNEALGSNAVPMTTPTPIAYRSSGPPGSSAAFVSTVVLPGARQLVATAPGLAFSNGQVIMPKHSGPKPQEDHTLINCFSVEQIELHIASLNKGLRLAPQKVKMKCLEVLKVLQSHQHGWVFNSPVDPVELGLPDYFEVIKKPMDLGTIRKKLENGIYHTLEDFEAHVHLTFDNAMLYNPEGSVVYNMAKEMKLKFQDDYEKLLQVLNQEEDLKRMKGEACLLCGCEKLLFEPPVFYCNGANCPSKRIRRNSYYYVGGTNQYHWCHQCFQELRDNQTIDLGDIQVRKEALVKKKNDEVHEESWVQCDRCERWVHQICALFNTRQNKDQRSEYACPKCTIEERKKKGNLEATSTCPMAEDLPRTTLSEYLEQHVRKKMDEFIDKKATALSEAEGINYDEAMKKVEMGGAVTIRQVTSMDRKLEVRERMKKRYSFKSYPDEFNFRCKCIVVFQNLDGVDVILFGLYVYEHDEKNPEPNKRAVYISYLDSVHYMRPREMRTFIYHEILISYLDYVRRRGFATAHIWACPPLKGDDYILYAKPEDQKTPKDDRLRQWYIDMLIESQKRGIVGKLTNMYDLYFSDPRNDATIVPYMDGDYFPAEVENIIKDIEEGKGGKKGSSQGKKKEKEREKKKTGRGGTRSAGLDEEALKASGFFPPGTEGKSLEEGGRDYVMMKLGDTIQPMKESFIVAYLGWKGASEDCMVVPKEIQDYRDRFGISWRIDGELSEELSTDKLENGEPGLLLSDASEQHGNAIETDTSTIVSRELGINEDSVHESSEVDGSLRNGQSINENLCQSVSAQPKPDDTKPDENELIKANLTIREGKFAAMAARKRDRDGSLKDGDSNTKDKPKEEGEKSDIKTITVTDSKGRLVKVLDDDEEELDCEFLNNRQAFLNLCQGNHYQFDQLRRAKHSSMMVLWHLHNRDAPKFVQQCATCSREILAGVRFHCSVCDDFDQCKDCVSNPKVPRHPHTLKPMPVGIGQQNEMTAAQRKERQRSIQLHMALLLHAATCTSPKCPSANCTKMKGLLKHGAQCQLKASGGCNVCKRIWALLQLHARQCKNKMCPVPNCMAIRERVRQLKKQQQAMDDRRRLEMNRAYRGKR